MKTQIRKHFNYIEIATTDETDISPQSFSQLVVDLVSHDEWYSGCPVMINNKQERSAPITENEVECMADTCSKLRELFGTPKVAIVQGNSKVPDKFEKIKFWNKFAERHMDVSINTFSDRENAAVWLNHHRGSYKKSC